MLYSPHHHDAAGRTSALGSAAMASVGGCSASEPHGSGTAGCLVAVQGSRDY